MDPMLIVHVAGGAAGLLAGSAALLAEKGAGLHKRAGLLFVFAMLGMAVPGGVLALLSGKTFDVLSSWLTCYMVLSGWFAFSKPQAGRDGVLACVGAGCLLGYLAVELYALATGVRATEAPMGVGYFFAMVMGMSLWGDYRLFNRTYPRKQLLMRHLWRMNFGLLLATASFFGARPHLFPEWMQSMGLLILLSLAPVLVLGYWLLRLYTSLRRT